MNQSQGISIQEAFAEACAMIGEQQIIDRITARKALTDLASRDESGLSVVPSQDQEKHAE